MKKLFPILFFMFATIASAQTELLRPTIDANQATGPIGCTGNPQTSVAMPLSYDSAGITTHSQQTTQGTRTVSNVKGRVFRTWAATSNSYSALVLNVNFSSVYNFISGSLGQANIQYSINGGMTWTSIFSSTGSMGQTTVTKTLSPTQDLSLLAVATCVESDQGGDASGDIYTINIFDIWTVGTTNAPTPGTGPGPGPQRPSAVIVTKAIWKKDLDSTI